MGQVRRRVEDAVKERDKGPTRGVQSVGRVFALLDLLAASDGTASLSSLALRSGLPSPTIYRLLRTGVDLGYVSQLPSREYALGPGLIRLGAKAERVVGLLAAPELKLLVDRLEETANLAMLDREMVVYVAQHPSPHAMRMFTEVGGRVHMHNSGVGKAILAQLDDDHVARIITRAGMPSPTMYTHTTLESLMADLRRIRERGYAVDDQEQSLGVRCCAVAIPGAKTPMACSVSGPVARLDPTFPQRAAPSLLEAAGRISAAFAARPDAATLRPE